MALDATTGNVSVDGSPGGPTGPTRRSIPSPMAPQVYDGMVIVGSSGAEYPTRGFVAGA